jgi:hypothetical protein
MLSSGSAKARICSLRTMQRRPSLQVGGEVRRGEGWRDEERREEESSVEGRWREEEGEEGEESRRRTGNG